MSQKLPLDPYITDVLMRDLVGHDRTPSAFIVYLWLWRMQPRRGPAPDRRQPADDRERDRASKSAVAGCQCGTWRAAS